MLKIKYNNIIVNKQLLTPFETKTQPKIIYKLIPNELYTLIMYDPDTPHGDYLHWVIINIRNNINNGKTIVPYKGPAPPINTGIHRYILLLFKQNKIIVDVESNSIERNFKLSNLLNKLEIISKPEFENYFLSQYQDGGNKKYNKKRKSKKKQKNKYKITHKNKHLQNKLYSL